MLYEVITGAIHLSVPHDRFRAGYNAPDGIFYLVNILHPVVNEKNLPVTRQLVLNGLADDLFIKAMQLGNNWVAVGRRRLDDRQVAGTHQRKLQGTRDWRGRQRERVYIHLQLFQFFFHRNAKFLFLIHNQQTQVSKFHIFAHQAMSADENIDA